MIINLEFTQEYADSVEWLWLTADNDFYPFESVVDIDDLSVSVEADPSYQQEILSSIQGKYNLLKITL